MGAPRFEDVPGIGVSSGVIAVLLCACMFLFVILVTIQRKQGNAGTGILQALSELERLQGDVDGLEYPHTGRATDDIMGLEGEMWASGGQGFRNLDD
mmetsp:Transcript_42234/g.99843  ORF Transcript_42234/g.99843 Transcript_42234/m.99843 type:complete len:97 (-) Transcript_42234:298-588(-)|eukprot:CAMPEP_0177748642 /NCGR_PEP_ID=MMETSP0484_2-20121128/32048_1 /TAXON_ID=354590 /ORGANISM="Rhodomonas lens, Strain RHODO" /LENGTH=96 /DNA_ID=CAMNT_0019263545 /DNA_START=190 /DNA_END=480 /DNA_ORIENTATION=+